jgi:hypothetical protein
MREVNEGFLRVSAPNEEENNEPLMKEGVSATNEKEPLKSEVTKV